MIVLLRQYNSGHRIMALIRSGTLVGSDSSKSWCCIQFGTTCRLDSADESLQETKAQRNSFHTGHALTVQQQTARTFSQLVMKLYYVPSGFCRRITAGNQSSKELVPYWTRTRCPTANCLDLLLAVSNEIGLPKFLVILRKLGPRLSNGNAPCFRGPVLCGELLRS
jgi:hypothetical protein